MPFTKNAEVSIYYEVDGAEGGATVVLVAGGGSQLIWWRPEIVDGLRAHGFRVVRLDNRDVGLSQRFGGPADLDGHYSLADMGSDVLAVADAVGSERVHLVGTSMGGLIAQRALIMRPDRIASITLIGTAPGHPAAYYRDFSLPAELTSMPSETREEIIELDVRRSREIAFSPGFPADDPWLRDYANLSHDRSHDPAGLRRQQAAVDRETESFLPLLAGLTLPASIIQGRADRIALDAAGFDLMDALSNADLHFFAGAGHGIPHALARTYVDIIARTIHRGEGRGESS